MTARLTVPIVQIDKTLPLPIYAHHDDAGMDLYAAEEVFFRDSGQRHLVRTGIAVAIPPGYAGFVHPRSGLAHKHGITVLNAPGTVDAGYRGEIMVNLIYHGRSVVTLNRGERIAQIVFQRVVHAQFTLVDELPGSPRGTGGHGSTGRR
jgi:dUTP pyrophosphatase